MRALAISPDRSLTTVELPEPALQPDEVRIAVRFCGICGSDLHMRDMPEVPPGVVLGHEFTGVVTGTGSGVSGWAPGDRVAVNPFDPCGWCDLCGAGRPELCPTSTDRGVGLGRRYGAYAESVVAPQGSLFRLPDEVSDEHGALAEPLAVGLHAVNLAAAQPASRCVVLGSGPIGIMTALALRAKGVGAIVVVEPVRVRRDAVSQLGFAVSDAGQPAGGIHDLLGGAPELVFDCTGHPAGLPAAADVIGPAGKIVVVGVPASPSAVHLAPVVTRELQILGSLAYTSADFTEAIIALAEGRIPAADLITTIAPLEHAEHWFGELTSGTTQQIKVLLQP
jgi:(R,R)-butanediol dehydrogenase/meso-butanediol dehydrogenase/diacetyl reductase